MKGVGSGDRGETEVSPMVREMLRSSGQPLDPTSRAFMEPRFGHDFARVRVHTDERAVESARALDALAYTVGTHVAFGAQSYAPGTATGRRVLAHELAHVVQNEQAGAETRIVRRQPRQQGEVVSSPGEQRRRFVEAFNENPRAALADAANLLEIGGGQFEVYGLVYVDNETGELDIVRRIAPDHRAVLGEVRRLLAREVTDVQQQMAETSSLLRNLEGMTGVEAWLNNLSIRPGRALGVLARVQSQLAAGQQGYPGVSSEDLGDVESAIERFSHSHAMNIPAEDRPRPEGKTLLGYFHTHPTTSPPSGIRGVPSAGGDIGVAEELGEGSFLITGTPDEPLIYFIAEGKYWDLTNGLRAALDSQVSFVAGFDEALGGAFGQVAFGREGFGIRARASARPGLRISQGFSIGDYRLTLAGELNPAVATGDPALLGRPEARRLVEASSLGGEVEFSFRNQPFIPGSISLQVLSAGAVRIEGRVDPIPLPVGLQFVGGATLFEGTAGLEAEGFVGLETRPVPLPVLPGGVGLAYGYVPGRNLSVNVFYENPWMRVDYAFFPRSEEEGRLTTNFSYRLPAGTLRMQLGYAGQLFGSIGYQLPLP